MDNADIDNEFYNYLTIDHGDIYLTILLNSYLIHYNVSDLYCEYVNLNGNIINLLINLGKWNIKYVYNSDYKMLVICNTSVEIPNISYLNECLKKKTLKSL